jgi:hypothetical protein
MGRSSIASLNLMMCQPFKTCNFEGTLISMKALYESSEIAIKFTCNVLKNFFSVDRRA